MNAIREKHVEMGTMTISNAAIAITHATLALSASNLAVADVAYITTTGGALRLLTTGDDPTATVGVPVSTTGMTVVEGNANINNIKMIRESADGVVTVILAVRM